MKTPLTGIQSNVLNILTSLTLMGGGYIATEKKLSPPSSAMLAVIDSVFLLFCLTWITFCLQAQSRARQPLTQLRNKQLLCMTVSEASVALCSIP